MDGLALVEPSCADWIVLHRRKILLLITLLAGVLRFSYLNRPPLWLDEAWTYSRVCGTYRQMLDILRFDGFPPLHYELYWLLGKCVKLTPVAMRLIPALQGTLMVPAIYFLAVQMVSVRTALLTAAFTASSAYMTAYSHDAKMYMGAWLYLTVNVACLLWWQRSAGRKAQVAWLAWIASGLAMASTHYTTLVIVAIEPLIFLTARWQSRIFLTPSPGTPACGEHRRAGEGRGGGSSKLPWGLPETSWPHWLGRTLLFLIGIAFIVGPPLWYFMSFSHWRQEVQRRGFAEASGLAWVSYVNATRHGPDLLLHTATAYLLSWEWPTLGDQFRINADVLHVLMILSVMVLGFLAIGAFPWRRGQTPTRTLLGNTGEISKCDAPQPRWITRLWLACWIVPVCYGWYCASTPRFGSPLCWLQPLTDLLQGHWGTLLAEIAVLLVIIHVWPATARYIAAAIGIIAALSLIGCFITNGPVHPLRAEQWHQAYWSIAISWWKWIAAPQALLAMLAVLPVLAWHFSGDTAAERVRRTAMLLLTAALVIAICIAVYVYYLKRADRLALRMMSQHRITDWKMAKEEVWQNWSSVWVPRYLGIIWPAVAISVCALLVRLPTRTFRYAAITLLLMANLAMGAVRIFAGTEPPMDRIVEDVRRSQPPQPTRTILCHLTSFMLDNPVTPSVLGMQGRYYLSQWNGRHITPEEFRTTPPFVGPISDKWNVRLALDIAPKPAANRLRELPDVRRLIVWDVEPPNIQEPERYSAALGPQWKRISTQRFAVRMHWDWLDICRLVRWEYVKADEPATRNIAR